MRSRHFPRCHIAALRLAETLHGKDAIVIVSAEAFDRDRERHTCHRLVEALATSPLRGFELERPFVTGRVRDVDL